MNLPEEQVKLSEEVFDRIYKGDERAISLSLGLLDLLNTWDDLIDKDNEECGDEDINRAFFFAMIELTASPLWDTYAAAIMRNVYFKWQAANMMEQEKASDNEIAKAWMLRAGFYDLWIHFADKLYGPEWAKECAYFVYHNYGETLEEFLKEV